jgi:hypothetical protein
MIVFLIITCHKYYESRWKKHFQMMKLLNIDKKEIEYIYIIGDKNQEKEFVYNEGGHILSAKVADTYEGLPAKVMTGIKYIYEKYNPEGILKFDDDVIINKYDDMLKLINNCKNNDYFGAVVGSVVDTNCRLGCGHVHKKCKFAYGWMYYISRKSIKILVNNFNKRFDLCIEDCLIGSILNDNNIVPTKMNNLITNNIIMSVEITIYTLMKKNEKK